MHIEVLGVFGHGNSEVYMQLEELPKRTFIDFARKILYIIESMPTP